MSSQHHHIISFKTLALTFGGLLALTTLTVLAALVDFSHYTIWFPWQINLGGLNIIIAMLIACCKASLVVLFFMGLRWDKPLNIIIFLSNLLILFIFFVLTLSDVWYRDWADPIDAQIIPFESPVNKTINAE